MKYPFINSLNAGSPSDPLGSGDIGRSSSAPKASVTVDDAGSEVAQPPAALASDAPASNRASERYKDDHLAVRWQGVDSLELSYRGELDPDQLVVLDRLKEDAKSSDGSEQARAWLRLAGRHLMVKDRGSGRFKFTLSCDDFEIKVRGQASGRLPLAYVQLRASFLARVGPREAEHCVRAVVEELGTIEPWEMVGRIDLAADFETSTIVDAWDRRSWVTRAKDRKAHSEGDLFSGWSIGLRGPMAFRLYDKTLEIETRSRKVWLYDLWSAAGWFLGDRVWRAEFQIRRPVLAQFRLRGLGDVLAVLPALWAYGTQEWLRLTIPDADDTNRARWPLHPLWASLQRVPWVGSGLRLTRAYRASNAPSDRALVRQLTAAVTSEMAKEGHVEYERAFESVRAKFESYWQDRQIFEGAPIDRLMLDRALKKERRFGMCNLAMAIGQYAPTESASEPGAEG